MQKNTEISEQTKQIILKLQQMRLRSRLFIPIYPKGKKQSDKEILERLGKKKGCIVKFGVDTLERNSNPKI